MDYVFGVIFYKLIYHLPIFPIVVGSVFISITSSTPAFAEQKYNPHTEKWKTVSSGSMLKYNIHSRSLSYVSPDAIPKYNIHTGKWKMTPPNYQHKYNPYIEDWETSSPDSELQYNPYEKNGDISHLEYLLNIIRTTNDGNIQCNYNVE